MADKIGVAIVGSGNIGTDLMLKLEDHPRLEMKLMVGIDPRSEGLALASQMGFRTTAEGIEGFKRDHEDVKVVYEATSAKAHMSNAPLYKELGQDRHRPHSRRHRPVRRPLREHRRRVR